MSKDSIKQEIVLEGIAASPGVAHGTALVYLKETLDVPCYDLKPEAVEGEIERFDAAILGTRSEITEIRNKVADSLGEGEARIFDAHLMVLEDSALIDEVILELRNSLKNVEYCYNAIAQKYISFFKSMEDEYLRERVSDIEDVSRRLLHTLIGKQAVKMGDLGADSIIVSEDISPSDTADLNRKKLLGFVTDSGGKTSHSVIMARSLGIPAVVGTHDATVHISSGDQILVDGHDGLVVINPSEKRLYKYGKLATERRKLDEVYRSSLPEPSETKDGFPVEIMANIEGVSEMEAVSNVSADGVGLFRTEGVFLRSHGYPAEEVQFREYSAVVKAAAGKPVIIRTLDIGGDKTISQSSDMEDNSFMGFRAIRFCLKNESIFKAQLRAILRASAFGCVKIMYPMISGLSELRQANLILKSVQEDLVNEGIAFDPDVEVGIMIEVPSAAVIVDLLAKESDFLSIGTNDLIQYLMAVDRLNDKVAHLYTPTHPAVLRTLKAIIDGGKKAGIPVGVCGEMAGEPAFVSLLVGMGADSLSLTSSMHPEVKYLLRHFNMSDARALVDEVLEIADPNAVMHRLEAFRGEALGKPI